jgi:nucleotide-binding universal stress UspA family protein
MRLLCLCLADFSGASLILARMKFIVAERLQNMSSDEERQREYGKDGNNRTNGKKRSVMKILLATDGSECSDAAVEAVAKRPWPEGSEVKIISAIESPYVPTTETWVLPEGYFNELEDATRAQAETAVDQAAKRIESANTSKLEITTEIVDGPAKNAILDRAERWGADLIMIGSHGYSGWQRFLLGSVSHAVATHAHCSVEIVRKRKPA